MSVGPPDSGLEVTVEQAEVSGKTRISPVAVNSLMETKPSFSDEGNLDSETGARDQQGFSILGCADSVAVLPADVGRREVSTFSPGSSSRVL